MNLVNRILTQTEDEVKDNLCPHDFSFENRRHACRNKDGMNENLPGDRFLRHRNNC